MNGIIIANTGIFNNLTVTGASIFEGPVTITNTTESFACDEGALVIDGGVGIMGNLNVCGAITATGGISFTGPLIILDHTQSPIAPAVHSPCLMVALALVEISMSAVLEPLAVP